MRATRAEIDALIDEEEALDEQRRKLRQRHADALERRDLLDVTLRTHIYSKMPIVPAKMLAHEELSPSRRSPLVNVIIQSSASANSASVAAQRANMATRATSKGSQRG